MCDTADSVAIDECTLLKSRHRLYILVNDLHQNGIHLGLALPSAFEFKRIHRQLRSIRATGGEQCIQLRLCSFTVSLSPVRLKPLCQLL